MKAFEIPPEPAEPSQIGEGPTRYRYEDVAQDGRLRLEGMWASMGRIPWVDGGVAKAMSRVALAHGVRAVLTRVVMIGGSEPISAHEPAHTVGKSLLSHTVDESGAVDKILLSSWFRSYAPRRASDSPVSRGTTELVFAARAFGQNVFTKPTAKPPDHRVTFLDDPELPRVPPSRGEFLAPDELLALPEGAVALDPEPRLDPTPIVFGLMHTDGNRHVNFLTYPRLVEEAALRRLAEHDGPRPLLGRMIELGYRKPCFAGARARVLCQAWRRGDEVGIVAAFVADPGETRAGSWTDFGRPHCAARLLLTT